MPDKIMDGQTQGQCSSLFWPGSQNLCQTMRCREIMYLMGSVCPCICTLEPEAGELGRTLPTKYIITWINRNTRKDKHIKVAFHLGNTLFPKRNAAFLKLAFFWVLEELELYKTTSNLLWHWGHCGNQSCLCRDNSADVRKRLCGVDKI